MVQRLYSVRDLLAEEYGPVFTAKNDRVAMRQFLRMVSEEKINGEEYEIFRLGEFNSETGHIEPMVINLKDVVIDDKDMTQLDLKLEEFKQI